MSRTCCCAQRVAVFGGVDEDVEQRLQQLQRRDHERGSGGAQHTHTLTFTLASSRGTTSITPSTLSISHANTAAAAASAPPAESKTTASYFAPPPSAAAFAAAAASAASEA